MKKFLNIFFIAIVLCGGIIGITHACSSNQIDIGNGNCENTKFTITTTNLNAGDEFNFYMSASGTFYVDCGDGGTLSGTGVTNNTITRNDTTEALYTCTYSTAGAKTIKMAGLATGYCTGENYPAIRLFSGDINYGANSMISSGTEIYIHQISGSIGAIFPTLTNPVYGTGQPSFYMAFRNFINVDCEIPVGFFDGVYGQQRSMMFYSLFNGSKFTGNIPSRLFSQITMLSVWGFGYAFGGCDHLSGEIPGDLFENLTGVLNWGDYALFGMFFGCSGLSGYIPPSLFAGLIANGLPYTTNMMGQVFYNTNLATTCPTGYHQYITGYEDDWGARVSCEPNTINITWEDATPESVAANNAGSCTYGGTINTPAVAPSKRGYVFTGWSFDVGSN